MRLSAAELTAIETLLAAPDGAAALRQAFPRLPVTRCDASDLDADTPYRSWPHLSLYLVDGSAHCLTLTTDPARATGVVLATPRKQS